MEDSKLNNIKRIVALSGTLPLLQPHLVDEGGQYIIDDSVTANLLKFIQYFLKQWLVLSKLGRLRAETKPLTLTVTVGIKK